MLINRICGGKGGRINGKSWIIYYSEEITEELINLTTIMELSKYCQSNSWHNPHSHTESSLAPNKEKKYISGIMVISKTRGKE